EKARAAAQQSRRDGPLERVGRAIHRKPGGDGGGGEAVVGQRDEHRLEDAHLLRRGALLRRQPERQLAEANLANQLSRQVVPEQLDTVGVGCADACGILGWPLLSHRLAPYSSWLAAEAAPKRLTAFGDKARLRGLPRLCLLLARWLNSFLLGILELLHEMAHARRCQQRAY